jgi:hypothetical protein
LIKYLLIERMIINDSMDTSTEALIISNLLVAIGTIVLAVVAYLQIKESKKQSKMFYRQTGFLRNQQIPILCVDSFNIKENTLNINLRNIGNGIATKAAILSNIYIAKADFYLKKDDKKSFSFEEMQALSDKINSFYVKFSYEPKQEMKYEGKKVFLSDSVAFLFKEKTDSLYIMPNQTESFSVEPLFQVKSRDKSIEKFFAQFLGFSELIKLLKENNVKFFAVNFSLEFKDINEMMGTGRKLTDFVVDVSKHKSLEEAMKDRHRVNFQQLDDEGVVRTGFADATEYMEVKSVANLPEHWEEYKL